MMDLYELYVKNEDKKRLDAYIADQLDEMSRSYIHKLIKKGLVLVNGNKKKAKYIVKNGDLIQVNVPHKKEIELIPQDIPLNIVYEDQNIIVINKPTGMVVHPAQGNHSDTLVNALLYHTNNLSSLNDRIRPGIVHRLDKDTSGLLVVAKNNKTHKNLANQLIDRKIKRVYVALVYEVLDKDEVTINAPIGRNQTNRTKMAVTMKNSKEAITHYKVLERFQEYTLIEVSLQTGRTHQIRVHMDYINHPIVGDPKYTNRKNEFGIETQLLHAKKLGLINPTTGKYMEFYAEIPDDFRRIIKILRQRNR